MARLGLLLALVATASLAPVAQTAVGVDSAHVGRLALFVLAGQSNMSGRAPLDEVQPPDPDIYVFGNDDRWRLAVEPVDSPEGQVDAVSLDRAAGFGPSRAFADSLKARYPDLVIGLIPCAMGATIIEEWHTSVDDATLYGSCLKRVRAAEPMGRLSGVLFFQGESDTNDLETLHGFPLRPDTWATHFTRYVHDLRSDLRQPQLPVVFAQIGAHTAPDRYVNWTTVQAQQASVDLPQVRMIRTSDLSLIDRVHYDVPSYRTIGGRFAAAMAELLGAAPGLDIQGHRGGRGLLPENSLPAMRHALDLGVTTLEMDAVVSADGQVLLSHEPWFNAEICSRPDGTPVPAHEEDAYSLGHMTYAEIVRFDCGSRGNPHFPSQQAMPTVKPLLDDVLDLAEGYVRPAGQGPIRYNIEIKSSPQRDSVFTPLPPAYARALYDVLKRHGVLDRATVQSFDPRALEAMRAIDPTVPLAFLVDNDDGLAANLDRLSFTPDAYSPHQRLVDAAMVVEAHRRGVQVIPWTVNDVEAMRALVDLGVDGLISDYPDRALAAVGRR